MSVTRSWGTMEVEKPVFDRNYANGMIVLGIDGIVDNV